jgi:hypothetical protein
MARHRLLPNGSTHDVHAGGGEMLMLQLGRRRAA